MCVCVGMAIDRLHTEVLFLSEVTNSSHTNNLFMSLRLPTLHKLALSKRSPFFLLALSVMNVPTFHTGTAYDLCGP